jgi:hypothetical protein
MGIYSDLWEESNNIESNLVSQIECLKTVCRGLEAKLNPSYPKHLYHYQHKYGSGYLLEREVFKDPYGVVMDVKWTQLTQVPSNSLPKYYYKNNKDGEDAWVYIVQVGEVYQKAL